MDSIFSSSFKYWDFNTSKNNTLKLIYKIPIENIENDTESSIIKDFNKISLIKVNAINELLLILLNFKNELTKYSLDMFVSSYTLDNKKVLIVIRYDYNKVIVNILVDNLSLLYNFSLNGEYINIIKVN